MDQPKPFRMPITIGVTGHRLMATVDLPAVEKAVGAILDALKAEAPQTPLLLLSGLAEGADRLVAQIAMEKHGAELCAVLPMSAEDYKLDFATPESRAEFDRLLASSRLVVTPESRGMKVDRASSAERKAGYAGAGEWIALNSHLLIALWDGEDPRGKGGTAEIVAAKLRGRCRDDGRGSPLHYDEGGAVAHVLTPREGEPPSKAAGTVTWLYPDVARIGVRSGEHRYQSVVSSFETFNRLLVRRGPPMVPSPAGAPHVATLRSAASAFARRFQSLTHGATLITVLASVVAAAATAIDGLLSSTVGTFVTAAAIVIGAGTWAFSSQKHWQRLHTDCRALAEACRVQAVWIASGLPYCVADHYHPVQAASVQWIRRAVRTAHMLDNLPVETGPVSAERQKRYADAALAWIKEQVGYFLGDTGVVPRYRRQARLFAILGLICFAIGVLVLGSGKLLDWMAGNAALIGDPLLNVGKLVLAVGASMQAYQAFMGFGDLQRSFTVSAHLYSVADAEARAAEAAGDYERLKILVFELGQAALFENVNWVLIRRQRRVRPSLG